MENDLMNRKQVKEYFGITYPTLQKLIKDGIIPCYRLGKRTVRFKEHEIKNSVLKVIPKNL